MEIVRVAVNGYGVIGKRVVDAGPKGVGAANLDRYRAGGSVAIMQRGEKHGATDHSLVAQANYVTALGRDATRVVSCRTTAFVRVLGALAEGAARQCRGVSASPCSPGESSWAP